jgi:hypothetical protein
MIDGLQSAQLKIWRAAEHLRALNKAVHTYAGTDLHKLIPKRERLETLNISVEPPPQIGVLVGEIVYQLRSALDHLAFSLVQLNPHNVALPNGWEKRCAFPLFLKIPTHGQPPVPHALPVAYRVFEQTLPGITNAAYAFIESVQPYYGLGTANALKVLTELSNIDKHRHLNITVTKVAVKRHYELDDGTTLDSVRGGFKHGTDIEFENPGDIGNIIGEKRSLHPYVTFAEPTVGSGVATLEVENVLEVCAQQIREVIVPSFSGFLNNP